MTSARHLHLDVIMTNPPVGTEDDDVEPVYPSHVDFFTDYLAPRFARDFRKGDARWCAAWPDHPEADTGIEGLWRSWEDCTLDPGRGLATWLVQYAYPIMRQLWDERGCFDGCSPTEHAPRAVPLPG